ncbi:MAG: PAS domain S-box protein [Candidatus Zixiibacteriota bacterium]|nr:MAG: PAS domain S-box protein [candidate division Zixibacteria bacterium]
MGKPKKLKLVSTQGGARQRSHPDTGRGFSPEFKQLFELLPVAVIVADHKGRVAWLNQSAYGLLGYAENEVKNLTLDDVLRLPQLSPVVASAGQPVCNLPLSGYSDRIPLVRKNGTSLSAQVNTAALKTAGRQYYALTLDVSEVPSARIPPANPPAQSRVDLSDRGAPAWQDAPFGYHSLDPEGRIIDVNQAWLEHLGYARSEVIGASFSDLLSPQGQEDFQAGYARFQRQGRAGDVQIEMIKKDGSLMVASFECRAVYDESDNFTHSHCLFFDITEHKRVQNALGETEARFRALAEVSPDAICVHKAGRIVFINPAGVRLLGADTTDRIVGRQITEFVHPDSLDRIGLSGDDATGEGATAPFSEEKLLTLDGRIVDVEAAFVPLSHNGDEAVQMVARDITDRKRMERELQKSEEKYRAVVEDQTELVCRWLPDGRLLFVNEAYCRYFGKKADDLVGHSFMALIPDADHEDVLGHFRSISSLTPVETHEHRVLAADGEIRWQQWTNRAIFDAHGNITEFLSVGRDITDRKRAEAALRYRLDFEHLIMSLSSRFIALAPEEISENVVNVLRAVGEFTGADRCYVFRLSADRETMDNTHEWCADEIESHIDSLHNLPTEAFAYSLEMMVNGEVFHVPRVADLPQEAAAEKTEFQRERIQSVLCVPMMRQGECIGFLGFDSVKREKTWSTDEIGLLRVVGEMLVTAVEREQAERAVRQSEQRFRTMADFTYDWEYWLGADGKCVYVTPSCETTTGYKAEEFARDFGLMRRITHPDDLPALDRHLKEKVRKGKVSSLDFRIITRGGEERWINHVCQPVFADDGTYLGRRASNHDITDRKLAEDGLRRERDRAQTYLDVAGTVLLALDTNGRVVLINRKGCEILACTEGWAVGANWFDTFVPDSIREAARENFKRHISGHRASRADYLESPVITADGREKMIAWYNTMLRDESGRIKGTLSSGLDITESRRIQKVQAALFEISEATNLSRNLEELLETIHRILGTLIDTTNFYVALYDEQTGAYTFPYIVDEHLQQLPSTQEQLNKTLTDYVRRTGQPLLADGKIDKELEERGEVGMVGKPSEVWLGVPLKTASGVIGVVAVQSYTDPRRYQESDMDLMTFVSRHISMAIERKLAEDALRESEKMHRSLVETLSEGLVVLDAAGAVTFANKTLCEMLGATRNDLTGSDLSQFLDRENRDLVKDRQRDCQPGSGESYEVQWLRRDGGVITTIVSPEAVTDAEGRIIGSFAVITDISEWKKAEDKLRQATTLLRTEREALTQKNIALKEILEHIEKERQDYKQRICQDVQKAVAPFLGRLKAMADPDRLKALEALEEQLTAVLAKDIDVFRDKYATLTPRELEICELIKVGMTSKEIGQRLSVSLLTVHKHREQIRRKLGLTSKGINLSTYLQSH